MSSQHDGPRRRERVLGALRCWESPPDQPLWARPVLLVVAALSAVAYSAGAARASIEPYYGAAARSMSQSWRDFVFGAFDPSGTVTVDKLPGALWPQAMSLRIFGFHIWAFVLPQVVEGVITILVLYRAIRLFAGPVAGIVAAVVLASSPITVLLNRGNISDSLLILFLVLAAEAATRAVVTGTTRPLYIAAAWVGLAFQAKMMQAWLILPGIWLAYGVAGAPEVRKRVAHSCGAAAVTGIVSLSWMSVVSLVPRHDRPFVDGSNSDSLFAQVFQYNGVLRFQHSGNGVGTPAPFLTALARQNDGLGLVTSRVPAGWHRLLTGAFGRDAGWLLPLAAISLVMALWSTRGSGRRDPVRAGSILWGGWLLVTFAAFSAGRYLNSYYVAALVPAVAALVGTGSSLVLRGSSRNRTCGAAMLAVVVTAGYAVYLLRGAADVPRWLDVAVVATAGIAVACLASVLRWGNAAVRVGSAAVASLAVLLVPATASATSVVRGLGPFDSPFEPDSVTVVTQSFSHRLAASLTFGRRERAADEPLRLATETSGLATHDILFSGLEVLPIGGYTGAVPSPTLAELERDVATSKIQFFLIATTPANPDPRFAWIRAHCHSIVPPEAAGTVKYDEFGCLGSG
jgi:4-amino-4-deoxy-L-arabinose transferase-like glycosyltransferase